VEAPAARVEGSHRRRHGPGMLLGLWDYMRGPVTDADVDDELRRMRR
jgi:hypothetical protein